MSDILWREGNAWRDLTKAVEDARAATVVSMHGTALLVDINGRRWSRMPLEGGQHLVGDARWHPLGWLQVTPCGAVIEGNPWYRGTRVRLVLAGLHDTWVDTDIGRAVLNDVMGRRAPSSPAHPDDACSAMYCPRRLESDRRGDGARSSKQATR